MYLASQKTFQVFFLFFNCYKINLSLVPQMLLILQLILISQMTHDWMWNQ